MAEEEHPVVTSDTKAVQAERSPNTFFILLVSLTALAAVALGLFWYFGVFDGFGTAKPPPAT